MKVMGLDVGSKTIGVAISDAFGWTAQGLTTIKWNESDIRSADPLLKKIVAEHEVEQIVIGLPKHMNGSIGERGLASQTYATHVEKIHQIPTFLWDERLSTRSEEHTSELQSRGHLVCRLLLEKKNNTYKKTLRRENAHQY